MNVCLKCGGDFPNRVVIDGKVRNLQRRKYCIECSPFKSGNTKHLHKNKPQLSEEEKIEKKKLKSKQMTLATQKRREKVKQMSIDYKGGKCHLCGYDKCSGALEFHHIDPKQKSFAISSKGNTRAWEVVKKELDKCVLVCANCHREIHAGLISL